MRWLSTLLITILLYSCASDKMYSLESKEYIKYNSREGLKSERWLKIMGNGRIKVPNYPADNNRYIIISKVLGGINSPYVLNHDTMYLNPIHFGYPNIKSPFGRKNCLKENNIITDSFYVPKKLIVSANTDFELSAYDTLTWVPDSKTKYISLLLASNDSGKKVTYNYLIKDDGQLILNETLFNQFKKSKYFDLVFSRSHTQLINLSDGTQIEIFTVSKCSGTFEPKKATP